MKQFILLTILISNFAIAGNSEICDLNNNEKKFADMTDSYIYKDEDYSPGSAVKSLDLMSRHLKGEELDHFIPQNHITIINGAFLQAKIKKSESRLEEAKAKGNANIIFELEVQLLKSTNEYCNYLRTHYHIDW